MKSKWQGLVATVIFVALITCSAMPSRGATATLSVDAFNGASGYVDMACVVNLTDSGSTWLTVDFHVGLVGSWTASSGVISVGGKNGVGDHRYPDPGLWWRMSWTPAGQTGTFDVWAVAHGQTGYPWQPWNASTGDHYYSYNG